MKRLTTVLRVVHGGQVRLVHLAVLVGRHQRVLGTASVTHHIHEGGTDHEPEHAEDSEHRQHHLLVLAEGRHQFGHDRAVSYGHGWPPPQMA